MTNIKPNQSNTINRNAFVLFAVLTILMLWTSCMLPLTWDEGNAIIRSEKIAKWVTFFWNRPAEISSPFNPDVIQKYCVQTTQIEGHPAGYVLLIAAGNSLAKTTCLDCLIDEKTCYRFGPILLFCFAVTAVYVRMGQTFGQRAAIFCVLCILFIPRVFAHAHIAACDSPLMSCWLLAWALFDTALKNKRGAILWGFVLGLGFSMKFPGWIISIPFLAFAMFELIRKRPTDSIAWAFALGFPTAVFVFYLLNPTLWHAPVNGFIEFVKLNTCRKDNYNIPIAFLGVRYSLLCPLPWYNTVLWAAITIPSGLLFFLLCFVIKSTQRSSESNFDSTVQNRLVILTVLNLLPLMIVRAVPGTPVHDGVRLFVSAFAFIGILAGFGAAWLWGANEKNIDSARSTEVGKSIPSTPKPNAPFRLAIRRFIVVCILIASSFNLFWYAPQWLSYYNLCIGGLPGAVRSGMEATYYWDALDDETLNWINEHAQEYAADKKNFTVSFTLTSSDNLRLLTRWSKLKVPAAVNSTSSDTVLSVFQCRAGVLFDDENKLFQTSKPVYRKALNRRGPDPWNLYRVPLVKIYKTKDYVNVLKNESPKTFAQEKFSDFIQNQDITKTSSPKIQCPDHQEPDKSRKQKEISGSPTDTN